MELTKTKMATPIARSIFWFLKEAHNLYGEHRVNTFLTTIDSEIDNLTAERQAEINEFLSQERSKRCWPTMLLL